MPDVSKPHISTDEVVAEEFAQIFGSAEGPQRPVPLEGLGPSAAPPPIGGPTALCLSGGGIRSATFSLGVLQALGKHGWLTRFDYLSTVSGGGFIGGWLTRWRTWAHDRNEPWDQRDLIETPDNWEGDPDKLHRVRRLRSFTSYLSPSVGVTRDGLTFLNSGLRKFGFNLLMWVFVFLALAALVRFTTALAGLAMNGFDLRSDQWHWLLDPMMLVAFVPPMLAFLLIGGLSALSLLFARSDWIGQEVVSSHSARLLLFAGSWLGLFGLFGVVPEWLWDYLARYQGGGGSRWLVFVTVATGAIATLSGYWSRIPQQVQKRARGFVDRLKVYYLEFVSAAALAIFAVAAGYFLRWFMTEVTQVLPSRAVIAAPAKAMYDAREVAQSAQASLDTLTAANAPAAKVAEAQNVVDAAGAHLASMTQGYNAAVAELWACELAHYSQLWPAMLGGLAALIVLAVIFSELVGANRSSLHSLYAMRLIRAFLGTTVEQRKPSRPTDYAYADDIPLDHVPIVADGKRLPLFPVINMTLNLTRGTGTRHDWQQRRGASFTATPLRVGSDALGKTGFARTETLVDSEGRSGMTLGRAMTISGAAASPNMGYYSRPIVAMAMAVLNIRLGWWFPNPVKRTPDDNGDFPPLSTEPLFGIFHVMKEGAAKMASDAKWLYLSDGGHFENLGLYEMVRRKCKQVLVVDAGCDGGFGYDDLVNAARKCQVDFGVPIDLPASLPGQEGDGKDKRFVVGRIRYSEIDPRESDGVMVLIKPIVHGTEPPAITHYKASSRTGSHAFPHHSTGDQFFDETQFESYRQLGFLSGEEVIAALDPSMFTATGGVFPPTYPKAPEPASARRDLPGEAPWIEDGEPAGGTDAHGEAGKAFASLVGGFQSMGFGELMLKTAGAVAVVAGSAVAAGEVVDRVPPAISDIAGDLLGPDPVGPGTQDDGETGSGSTSTGQGPDTQGGAAGPADGGGTTRPEPSSPDLSQQIEGLSEQIGALAARIDAHAGHGAPYTAEQAAAEFRQLRSALGSIRTRLAGIEDGQASRDARLATTERRSSENTAAVARLDRTTGNIAVLQDQIDWLQRRLDTLDPDARGGA